MYVDTLIDPSYALHLLINYQIPNTHFSVNLRMKEFQ